MDLKLLPQRAAHDLEVLGDAAYGRIRGRLEQVDSLSTDLIGAVFLAMIWIISPPQEMLDSACPRTRVSPGYSHLTHHRLNV